MATTGIPQGSILRPLLRNIIYDGVLDLCVPEEATLIGFVDDLEKHPEDVEIYTSETIYAIKMWLPMVNMDLADKQMKAVSLFTIVYTVKIRVVNHEIISKLIIRYLKVVINADT